MDTTKVTVRIHDIGMIDRMRGDTPRATYLGQLLENVLVKEGMKYLEAEAKRILKERVAAEPELFFDPTVRELANQHALIFTLV